MTSKPNVLEIISFGHSYGPLHPRPMMSYDLRNIPNPPREFRQQQKTSNDSTAVRQWLLTNEVFLARIGDARRDILQLMSIANETGSGEEHHHFIVGANCGLGRHRSVTFVGELKERLEEVLGAGLAWDIRVRHRDLWRQSSKRGKCLMAG
jgi:RNase adaptor protein for sRNA GlmZ degradation